MLKKQRKKDTIELAIDQVTRAESMELAQR